MHKQNRQIDLSGVKYGAHVDGPEVCKKFQVKNAPTPGVWGWNDTKFFFCTNCGKNANEHVVLEQPKVEAPKMRKPVYVPPPRPMKDPDALSESSREYSERAAAAARTNLDMLEECNDPLFVGAQIQKPKPKPPPPPAPVAPPVARPVAPPVAPAAPAGIPQEQFEALMKRAGDVGAEAAHSGPGVNPDAPVDPNVAALFAREKAYSEAFKDEVDRMVRESIVQERRKELDAELDQRLGAQQAAPASQKAEQYADAASLLDAVGLPQYKDAFAREAMDPATLADVMQAQGRSALEEVLKEMGITSMGHRMRVVNAVA